MYTVKKGDKLSHTFVEATAQLIERVWKGQSPMFRKCLMLHDAAPDLTQAFYTVAFKSESDQVLGFCMTEASNFSSEVRSLSWAVVDPSMERMGIGRVMVQACMDHAARGDKGIMLGTRVPGFFSKMGFQSIGRYMPDDRYLMQWNTIIPDTPEERIDRVISGLDERAINP